MIDRYILHADKKQLTERYQLSSEFDYTPSYNAVPTDLLPIIVNDKPNEISQVHWGQTLEWSNNKKLSLRLYNSNTTEFKTKKSLQKSLTSRKCLIPATGFINWKKVGKKTSIPYLYHLPEFQLCSFAGIWEIYSSISDLSSNDDYYIIFKLITVFNENYQIEMPLVLSKEAEKQWFSNEDTGPLEALLTNQNFKSYSISPVIEKNPANTSNLIKHVPPIDQSGNYTLFG